MGCDGGSIPTRVELVKTKEPPKKPDPNEIGRIKWTSCSITKEPLEDKVVADELGNLFSKESVIQTLVEKKKIKGFKHIKSLKDVFDLKLTSNASFPKVEGSFKWICPVTFIEASPKHKFLAIKTCGCVLSERAMKECPTNGICLVCNTKFSKDDVIPLNRTDEEEIAEQRKKMEEKKAAKNEKKQPKKETSASRQNSSTTTTTTTTTTSSSHGPTPSAASVTTSTATTSGKTSPPSTNQTTITSSTSPSSTSGPTPPALGEKRKVGSLIELNKKAKVNESEGEKAKKGEKGEKSVNKLPEFVDKSVYASIFTSSLTERKSETFLCRNVSRT
eukprot:TRINITY_DN3528_c0_g1_i2.p1 TRINITY_DN3528_c0_g1~~TRINITY_DN3528_c0_g1_i2.p1  ORF type:complete len:332 (-),score=114.20 TRINITY_DN3528_c0_g1_i2:198-1193(-)